MKSTIVIVISGDPFKSEKVAEALRVCAGIAAAGQSDVVVYLDKAAISVFDIDNAELLNQQTIASSLQTIAKLSCKILVDDSRQFVTPQELKDLKIQKVSPAQFSDILSTANYLLRF